MPLRYDINQHSGGSSVGRAKLPLSRVVGSVSAGFGSAGASPYHFQGARLRGVQILGLLILVVGAGCASQKWVSVRATPKNRLTDTLMVFSDKGPKPTERTEQLLRVYNLTDDFKNDPRGLLAKLQAIIERDPSIDKLHAFAELSYICARKVEPENPDMALDLYGASALYAYQYLFDSRFADQTNPYDPQFRGACDLYNGSLEAALRLVCAKDGLKPGKSYSIETAGGSWDIKVEIRGGRWSNEDFDHFEFVSDYEIKGLTNHYRSFGLGVPMIAVRRGCPNEPAVAKYYPVDLSFPVTVLMRPRGDLVSRGKADRSIRKQAVLEIYDPLTVSDIAINRHRVPLESDLSTPLAYFLSNPQLEQLATVGLLKPGRTAENKTAPRRAENGHGFVHDAALRAGQDSGFDGTRALVEPHHVDGDVQRPVQLAGDSRALSVLVLFVSDGPTVLELGRADA